jgi:hypothetical protein
MRPECQSWNQDFGFYKFAFQEVELGVNHDSYMTAWTRRTTLGGCARRFKKSTFAVTARAQTKKVPSYDSTHSGVGSGPRERKHASFRPFTSSGLSTDKQGASDRLAVAEG